MHCMHSDISIRKEITKAMNAELVFSKMKENSLPLSPKHFILSCFHEGKTRTLSDIIITKLCGVAFLSPTFNFTNII